MFEAVMTALCDKFESLRAKKPLLVVVSCGVMFLLGTTMCLEGGVFLFEVFDCYAAGLAILVLSISQLVCIQYVYGESLVLGRGSAEGPAVVVMFLYFAVSYLFLLYVFLLALIMFFFYSTSRKQLCCL